MLLVQATYTPANKQKMCSTYNLIWTW